jgi:hypothetical protein
MRSAANRHAAIALQHYPQERFSTVVFAVLSAA